VENEEPTFPLEHTGGQVHVGGAVDNYRLRKMPAKGALILTVLYGVVALEGCATVPLLREPVVFKDPALKLAIVTVEPSGEEASGILLRLRPPAGGRRTYREETTVFSQVTDKRGVKYQIVTDRTDTYGKGSRDDTVIVRSAATIRNGGGELSSEVEMTQHGEIVRCLRGEHRTPIGKFTIEDWKRSPIFPDRAVKVGDAWTYKETMNLRMQSSVAQMLEGEPYQANAVSTLVGFAMVGGVRCAVIETRAFEQKREHMKILRKELVVDVKTSIVEKTYLDERAGTVRAAVATATSYFISTDVPIEGTEESQSVTYLVR